MNHRELNQLSMTHRLRKNHDFLKFLVKCTPAQRKAILKVADDALVRTICECALNVLKETVPVSKTAKKKLLAHKKSLIALAEKKYTAPQEKETFGSTRRKFFKCLVTARALCTESNPYLE